MEQFILVLGEESNVLSGKAWTQYLVDVNETEMVCTSKKDSSVVVSIPYDQFKMLSVTLSVGKFVKMIESKIYS